MRIYVVQGTAGEWSDRTEWLVKAFHNEEAAQDYVNKASAEFRTIYIKCNNFEIDQYMHDSYDPNSPTYNKYDPQMKMSYNETSYYYSSVELE